VSHSAVSRWREHPYLGGFVRLVALVLPVVAAVATSALVSRALPSWKGAVGVGSRAAILLVSSGAVLFAVERLARRLVPLGLLLQLSISFPDRAPSRIRLAHRAGSIRKLERHIALARAAGVDDEPTQAAERIITLMAALSAHDRKTRGHSERVRVFSDLIADELRLSRGDRDRLRWAALLHDIGKLHLDADLLNKDGKPSDAEWEAIYRHPTEGARLTAPLAEWLGSWAAAIEQHHERYDGRGYPNRLAAKEISLGARIVGVADAYERMTSTASYKKPVSAATAREELTRCAGTQFDPSVVRAFLSISIGKLWWRTGPLSFLAQVPLLAWLPRLADTAGPLGGTLGAAAGTAAGAAAFAVTGILTPAAASAPTVTPAASAPATDVRAEPVVLATDLNRDEALSPTTTAPPTTTTTAPGESDPPPLNDKPNDDPRLPVSAPREPVTEPLVTAVEDLDPVGIATEPVVGVASTVPSVLPLTTTVVTKVVQPPRRLTRGLLG
jgi:putative nucleotidyltransferase with HDIG domain